jgi:hypothetical protein
VFVARSDTHGNKTMYIRAAAGAVIRNEATLAAIAEALKTFGDTRPVQHRRADAVGIIADPRYTQELLTQARHHHTNTPAQDTTAPDPTTPAGTAPDANGPDATTADRRGRRDADNHGRPTGNHAPTPAHAQPDRPSRPDGPDHSGHSGRGIDPAAAAAPAPSNGADPGTRSSTRRDDQDPLDDRADEWARDRCEPGPGDEADRDAPHPSVSDLPDPLDTPPPNVVEPFDASDPGLHLDLDDGDPLDAAARRALHARLAQIKHDAYTTHATRTGADRRGSPDRTSRRVRPGQTEIYVHLTDHTLATGTGVLRAEHIGPLIADQLADLIGHGPYTVKPVIDLNDAISVDAYEIPDRIRERIKLTHPVELFPYGTQETHHGMDLDHLQPYNPLGPPGQTNTTNLAPLGRYAHRVKTHAPGWTVHRIDHQTLEWTTPHGFVFHVTPTGTIRVNRPRPRPRPRPECPT